MTYINRKDYTNSLADTEYITKFNEYEEHTHLANLKNFEDITENHINEFTAPVDGRYTVDFYFKHDADLASFTNGLRIVISNTISVALKANGSTLNSYCFPHEYKDLIINSKEAHSKYLVSENASLITNENYNRQWIHYRCSVSETDDEYYHQRDGAYDTEIKAFNKRDSYRINNGLSINQYNSTKTDLLYRKLLHPFDKVTIRILDASSNDQSSRIYLRHFYYFNDYIPRNIDYRNYDLNVLPFSSLPSRHLSIDFTKFDHMRIDTRLEYTIDNDIYRVQLVKSKPLSEMIQMVDYTLRVPASCYSNRQFSNGVCLNTVCSDFEHCRLDNIPLTCPSGLLLMNSAIKNVQNTYVDNYFCSENCNNHTFISKTLLPVNKFENNGSNKAPQINQASKGRFCNFICDGSKYKVDSTWSRIDECNSLWRTVTNFTSAHERYICSNGLNRFDYKCWTNERAQKGRLYFNQCYDFPNMKVNLGTNQDKRIDYTIGFWFKLDNINDNCSWKPNTAKEEGSGLYVDKSYDRHLFYSNIHEIIRDNTSNDHVIYRVNSNNVFNNNRTARIPINKASWNHILLYVKNESVSNVNIHVNFKENPVNNSIIFSDSESKRLNLNLNDIVFCSRPDCLRTGDNIRWTAAYYKDLLYYKEIPITMDLIKDDSFIKKHSNLFTFPLNLLHSDVERFNDVFRNKGKSFELVDGAYDKNAERTGTQNYNTMFDWEEENLGHYIESENANSAFNFKKCNNVELNSGSKFTDPKERFGCDRCFDINRCYKCHEETTNYFNNFYLDNESCVHNSHVYTEFPPIKGSENHVYLNSFKFPLDNQSSNTTTKFKNLKQFTLTIFIKIKSLMEGNCSQNMLIRFHEDLIFCYDESSDSLVLSKQNTSQLAIISNYRQNYRNKWMFIGLSVNISNLSGVKNLVSFNINENEIATVSSNPIEPPTTSAQDYFVEVSFKYKLLLFNYRVFNTFILKPFGYVNHHNYEHIALHYNLRLTTELVANVKDVSNLCLNGELLNYPHLPKFRCTFDSAYHPYHAQKCENRNSLFSLNGITSCNQCDSSCVRGCTGVSSDNCSADNMTGFAYYTRIKSISSGQFTTESRNLKTIDLNRYSSGLVSNVKRSTTKEYSMDFWFFNKFYSTELRDSDFKNISFTWDGHLKMQIALVFNPQTSRNELNMECYLAFNKNRLTSLNNLKRDGLLDLQENIWTHLKCGVRLEGTTNNSYFTNLGRNSFLLTDYTFETNGTTTLEFNNSSNTNIGILSVANLNLWESFSIDTMNLNECTLRNPSNYSGLLHYFDGKVTTDFINKPNFVLYVNKAVKIGESVNSNAAVEILTGIFNQNANFAGYGIIDDLNILFTQDKNRECLNLEVSPYSRTGLNGVTEWTFACKPDKTTFSSYTTELKYSVLPDREIQNTIPTQSGRIDKYIISVNEKRGLCRDRENLEVFCITNYNSGGRIISDISSTFLTLDRQISAVETRLQINNLKKQLLQSYNESLYNKILNDLSGKIVGDELVCDLVKNKCTFGVPIDEGGACRCVCPCGKPLGNLCLTESEFSEVRSTFETAFSQFSSNIQGKSTTGSRRRALQITNNFNSNQLNILQNFIKTSLDASSTIQYVNDNYLSLVDSLLSNPKEQSIVNLIKTEYPKILEILDYLYVFYNKRLKEEQNKIFYKYLETNTNPRIIFDVTFSKFMKDSEVFKNYTQIINFEKTPEYQDKSQVMSIRFTEELIEYRNREIKRARDQNLFNDFEKFFDKITLYLRNVAEIAVVNNTSVDNPLIFFENGNSFNYTYVSEYFTVDFAAIKKTFNFHSLKDRFNSSYFNAAEFLENHDSKLFYYYYITLRDLPENYYYTVEPFSGNLMFQIYDQNRKIVPDNDKNIQLYLKTQLLTYMSEYLEGNRHQFNDNYYDKRTNESIDDIIRQPYYVDSKGNINYNWNKVTRINELHPKYLVMINNDDKLFDKVEGSYIRAEVNVPGRYFSTVKENEVNYEDYSNDYFWFRPEILRRSENYRRNPTIYVWTIGTFIFLVTFILFMVYRKNIVTSEDATNVISDDIKWLESKYIYSEGNLDDELEENLENSVIDQSSKQTTFQVFMNIMSTNRFSFIFDNFSFLENKARRLLNFWLFYTLFYLFFSLLLTFREIDLKRNYESYIENIVGYFFGSFGCALAANIIITLLLRDSRSDISKLKESVAFKNLDVALIDSMSLYSATGDWGLGIGDWGLGPIPNPQSPIPNPQSPLYLNSKINFNNL
jgi:hypothetical protein